MAAGIAAATAFAIVSGTAVAVGPATWQRSSDPSTTPLPSPSLASSSPSGPLVMPAAVLTGLTPDISFAPQSGTTYSPFGPTPAAPTPTPTPSPMPDTVPNARTYARAQLGARQFACLDALWVAESQWNPSATNATTGAYGIPQALPPTKMASAGSDWRNSPLTQVKWGLLYIATRYGTACTAWTFQSANSWY